MSIGVEVRKVDIRRSTSDPAANRLTSGLIRWNARVFVYPDNVEARSPSYAEIDLASRGQDGHWRKEDCASRDVNTKVCIDVARHN